jgi:hypothetical protein
MKEMEQNHRLKRSNMQTLRSRDEGFPKRPKNDPGNGDKNIIAVIAFLPQIVGSG